MADLSNSFSKLLKSCNPDPEKAGKVLLVLNAAGMIFAALSNTFATAIDKNTSKEDKGFLIPAGIATGVANIGLYYALTIKIINGLKDAAVAATNALERDDLVKNSKEYALKQIDKASKGLFKKSDNYIASMKEAFIDSKGLPTPEAITTYKADKVAGAGVLGAFVGAVVSCAILTPIIRDVSAYFVQKMMEKRNPEMSQKPYRPYFDPSHIGDGPYRRHHGNQPLSMRSYMLYTNGNMKI